MNVAVLPLTLIVPITDAPPALGCNAKVPLVKVGPLIGIEKVAETDVLRPTFVALFAGDVEETASTGAAEDLVRASVSPGCSPPQPNIVGKMAMMARKLPTVLLIVMLLSIRVGLP